MLSTQQSGASLPVAVCRKKSTASRPLCFLPLPCASPLVHLNLRRGCLHPARGATDSVDVPVAIHATVTLAHFPASHKGFPRAARASQAMPNGQKALAIGPGL